MFCLGDSLLLYCASLLRTIFASLARTHEFIHAHNVRNFPQAKLDSEIDASFLLNVHNYIILVHKLSALS